MTRKECVLQLVSEAGVLRPRDLDEHGIPRQYLRMLHEEGLVERVGRGLYVLPGADITEQHTLAEVAKRVPQGVVCLLSALRFHGLTTQAPFEVWLAVDRKAWKPRVSLPVRFVRLSREAMETGVEKHIIEGVAVRVFTPAKTVADCFKYRNKIGLDVAVEALRDCWRQRKATMDELATMAGVCRVKNVIRPYLESTT